MGKKRLLLIAIAIIMGAATTSVAQEAVTFQNGVLTIPAGMVEKYTTGFSGKAILGFGEPEPSMNLGGSEKAGYPGNGWLQHRSSPYQDRIGESTMQKSGNVYAWTMPDWAREEYCGSDYDSFMFNVAAEAVPGTKNWMQLHQIKDYKFPYRAYKIAKQVDDATPRPGRALDRSAIAIPRNQICK